MYKYIVFFGILAVVSTASVNTVRGKNFEIGEEQDVVAIVKSVHDRQPDGSFVFAYEGADGSFREEIGKVKNAGTDEEEIEVTGSYRYYDSEGQLVEVKYTANKDGFVPEGTNIPQEITSAARAAIEVARNQPVELRQYKKN